MSTNTGVIPSCVTEDISDTHPNGGTIISPIPNNSLTMEEKEGGGRLGGASRGGRDGDAGAVAGSLADGLGSGRPPE